MLGGQNTLPYMKGQSRIAGLLLFPHTKMELLGGRPALSHWCDKALQLAWPAFLCLVPARVCESPRFPFRSPLTVIFSGRLGHTIPLPCLHCL